MLASWAIRAIHVCEFFNLVQYIMTDWTRCPWYHAVFYNRIIKIISWFIKFSWYLMLIAIVAFIECEGGTHFSSRFPWWECKGWRANSWLSYLNFKFHLLNSRFWMGWALQQPSWIHAFLLSVLKYSNKNGSASSIDIYSSLFHFVNCIKVLQWYKPM